MNYDLISRFAQQLIEETQAAALPSDYLEDYQLRLEEQIANRLGIIALEKMDDEGIKKYEALIKKTKGKLENIDMNILEEIWQKHIKNFREVMEDGLREFAEEYKKNMQKPLDI